MLLNRFHLMRFRRPLPKLARISQEDLVEQSGSGATVIDVRVVTEFARGHVPGSLNICVESRDFASSLERFVPKESRVIFVAEKVQKARRAASELRRAGYPEAIGFIVAGDLTETDQLTLLNVFDLKSTLSRGGKPVILDVRPASAWLSTRIPGSKNIPLTQLYARSGELCSSSPVVVLCEDGYESALAASWLQSNGFDSVQHLMGGMHAYANGAFYDGPKISQSKALVRFSSCGAAREET
jgi:hydroxyacylglutathione hydrolase